MLDDNPSGNAEFELISNVDLPFNPTAENVPEVINGNETSALK